MKRTVLPLLVMLLPVAAPGLGQAPLAPPRDVVAPAIPGVVAAGTRIELVKYPVRGTEGPVGLPDGSGIIFTETRADHITKVDASGNTSTFVEKSNGSNGLGIDSEGRVYVATNLGVEVIGPLGQHLGVIPIGIWGGDQFMLRKPQNLAFSGPDKKTLYTVGANAVFRVQLITPGFRGRGK